MLVGLVPVLILAVLGGPVPQALTLPYVVVLLLVVGKWRGWGGGRGRMERQKSDDTYRPL
jgi:hypothetical protein